METVWFSLIALVLAAYVMLDGFDLGVGTIYLFVAKTDDERRATLNAIGPIWNGNEVWLVIGGGILFLAFPAVYAAALSGFYLGLFIVLWLVIARGLSLELRSQFDNPMWRSLWDGIFAGASVILAFALGAIVGNVLRGVPLNAEGYFFTPLWTTFLPRGNAGLVDWYTVLVGLLSVALLAVHGANYLAVKTEGPVHQRAVRVGLLGRWAVAVLAVIAVVLTPLVQPILARHFAASPGGYVFLAIAALALLAMLYFRQRLQDLPAFVSSSTLIVGLWATAVFGLFPDVLIATTDPAHALTVHNAAATPENLRIALIWFLIAAALAVTYMVFSYRSFRGKVAFSPDDEGY
jgi:cytochrome d ubiquinol oxidase subunit II